MRTAGAANWPSELEDQLRLLWASGESASKIASIMGRGLTRNSIIGKAHRMHLPARRPSGPVGYKRARVPTTQTAQKKQSFKKRADWTQRPVKPPALKPHPVKPQGEAWAAIEGVTPVSLLDLEAGHCRWPVGLETPFLFCGAPATHRHYCEHHHAWSVGQGTPFERNAIKVAKYVTNLERFVPELAA